MVLRLPGIWQETILPLLTAPSTDLAWTRTAYQSAQTQRCVKPALLWPGTAKTSARPGSSAPGWKIIPVRSLESPWTSLTPNSWSVTGARWRSQSSQVDRASMCHCGTLTQRKWTLSASCGAQKTEKFPKSTHTLQMTTQNWKNWLVVIKEI